MKNSRESHRCDGNFAAVRIGETNSKGRGLFSRCALAAGDTALVERPLAGMQSLDNAQDVMVCRNCLGFIGDVILQLELLYGVPRHECLWRLEARMDSDARPRGGAVFSRVVECRQGCGEVYCSEKCREEHFDRCHSLLCVGPIPVEEAPSHPLVGFRVHAAQTNEIFLLVGEVVARIVSDHAVSGRDIADAEAPFKDFVQEAWWDVVVARDDGLRSHKGATVASQKAEALPQTLQKLCSESSSYLYRALAPPSPLKDLNGVLSTHRFGTVIGMFEQNNVGIRVPSPIPVALEALLADVGDTEESVLVEVARLIRSIEGYEEDSESEACFSEESDSSDCAAGKRDVSHDACGACDGEGNGLVLGAEKCDAWHDAYGDSDAKGVGLGAGEEKCNASHEASGSGCIGIPEANSGDPDEVDEGEISTDHARTILENSLGNSFAPLDGTALYTLICAMNHSCRPNCVVKYAGRGDRSMSGKADALAAHVMLLENVDEGVELTQSYINNDMSLKERRKALEEYGFHCMCSLCLEESSKGDTS